MREFSSGFAIGVALAALSLPGCGNTESHPATGASNGAGASTPGPDDAGAGGTAADAGPLSVVGVLAPQAGSCVVKGDLAAPRLAHGTFDRSFASAYTAALLVGDNFAERVAVQGVDVQLTDAANTPLLAAFTGVATGFLDPESPAAVWATMIPSSVASALPAGEVVARVRVSGKALTDGRLLQSPVLAFPIDVCDGCLVQYPEAARDPASAGMAYQCRLPVAGDPDPAPPPCQLGIDETFSCTLCSADSPICASPANNPAQ